MTTTFTDHVQFPTSTTQLEQINLPTHVIDAVVGRTITVEILREEQAMSRRVDPETADSPFLIDNEGISWNDYNPIRVRFADKGGRVWRVPRHWLNGIPALRDAASPVTEEIVFEETLNLPTEYDLTDINIPPSIAGRNGRTVSAVEVRLSPGGSVKVLWRAPDGKAWRIPHDWRRRRVMLPDRETLMSQGIPDHVADECAHKIVSVNYHPGSLCCLPEHFRFRDERGGKWQVHIADCAVVGYGDARQC